VGYFPSVPSPSVYLDNAATTQVAPAVAEAILQCMRETFGNPSSAHRFGVDASRHLTRARETLLAALGDERGREGDLLWTSGGTEADALGILGAARARAGRGRHLVVTAVEHPAVLGCAKLLEAEGCSHQPDPGGAEWDGGAAGGRRRDHPRDQRGRLHAGEQRAGYPAARRRGSPARARTRRADLHIHCDAVQALGKVRVDVTALGADSVAVSAHKLHGPKGAGALWLKKTARLAPLWSGGGQQRGLRSGTENVPGIVGLAEASRIALESLSAVAPRVAELRDRLVAAVLGADLGATLNGAGAPRVPHIASLAFPGVPAEPLLHALEARGVYVSAGAACSSKGHGPSHVLKAIGLPEDCGTLRVSLAMTTTAEGSTRRCGPPRRGTQPPRSIVTPRDACVLRFGEIFLKGGNRSFFEARLVESVRRAIAGCHRAKIDKVHTRVIVESRRRRPEPRGRPSGRVSSASPRSRRRASAPRTHPPRRRGRARRHRGRPVARGGKPSFKVDCRRSDKTFPARSDDINRDVGGAHRRRARPARRRPPSPTSRASRSGAAQLRLRRDRARPRRPPGRLDRTGQTCSSPAASTRRGRAGWP
jgi:cysteine desulfurase